MCVCVCVGVSVCLCVLAPIDSILIHIPLKGLINGVLNRVILESLVDVGLILWTACDKGGHCCIDIDLV